MGFLSNLIKSYQEDDKAAQQAAPGTGIPNSINQSQPQPQLSPQASTSGTPPASGTPLSSSQTTNPQTHYPSALSTTSSSVDADQLYQNPRARTIKQLSVFSAGALFLCASVFTTRRAVARRLAIIPPRFYAPSNISPPTNGAVEAAEAFALATINVSAVALMLTGGAMFALDVVSAEDLRRRYKAKMGFVDNAEQGADEEIEEWVRGVLGKRDEGDYKGVAEGLTALVGVLAGKEEDKERLEQMRLEGREKAEGEGKGVLESVREAVEAAK